MADDPSLEIRDERPADIAAVRIIHRLAFAQDQEANIVDALRANGAAVLSLVALVEGRVVAHIIYSPLAIAGGITGVGLGPMAVHPLHQGRGIGSKLIAEGRRRLEQLGYPFIIVVGHPGYYPRFGFVPARDRGIGCEWDLPDDVFMVLVLDEAQMQGVAGQAKYRHEFSTVS